MPKPTIDLLQGTLDLLILKTLSWGPAHGYAVARWIDQLTGEVLQVGEGSLYPALHRLEERDWVESEWRLSDHNRRASSPTKIAPSAPLTPSAIKVQRKKNAAACLVRSAPFVKWSTGIPAAAIATKSMTMSPDQCSARSNVPANITNKIAAPTILPAAR